MTRARLPCSLHFPDQSLRTKVSIIQHSFSPEVTSLPTDSTHYSFSSIRAVVYGFSSNMRSKLVCLRRIIRAFICIFYATHTTYFHAYSYDTYILVVRFMKQNKDAVWSLALLLDTGVRADPKYSYSYDIIRMYVRIVTFDFSFKYFIFLVGAWCQVVGSRYVFFSVFIKKLEKRQM